MTTEELSEFLRMAALAGRTLKGSASEQETEELERWLAANPKNQGLLDNFTQPGQLEAANEMVSHYNPDAALLRIKENALAKIRKRRRNGMLKAAAIVVPLIIAASLFNLTSDHRSTKPKPVKIADAAPGKPKAVLILDDGEQVRLSGDKDSSFKNGATIQVQGQGLISYQDNGDALSKTVHSTYHTLVVPKGGEYQLRLSDGTLIWLNSASSIRFPASFGDKRREVEITGEAYFEVAKDISRPFSVKSKDMEIQVLGTAFNLNAYHPERIRTTLVSGKVRLNQMGTAVTMEPGNTGYFDGKAMRSEPADLLTATAWKRGVFRFRRTPMQEVMNQLERWYNVSYTFEQQSDRVKEFNGEISRDVPLSKVLEMIELTGIAHFKLQDTIIEVQPTN